MNGCISRRTRGYTEDVKTTIRYLGIDLDDMGATLSRMYAYQYDLTRRK